MARHFRRDPASHFGMPPSLSASGPHSGLRLSRWISGIFAISLIVLAAGALNYSASANLQQQHCEVQSNGCGEAGGAEDGPDLDKDVPSDDVTSASITMSLPKQRQIVDPRMDIALAACRTVQISGHTGELAEYVNGYYTAGESDALILVNDRINYQKARESTTTAKHLGLFLMSRQDRWYITFYVPGQGKSLSALGYFDGDFDTADSIVGPLWIAGKSDEMVDIRCAELPAGYNVPGAGLERADPLPDQTAPDGHCEKGDEGCGAPPNVQAPSTLQPVKHQQ